jgi:hypothetical protein
MRRSAGASGQGGIELQQHERGAHAKALNARCQRDEGPIPLA